MSGKALHKKKEPKRPREEEKKQDGDKGEKKERATEGAAPVGAMTAKEIKKLARPEFQKNFEKYYPVKTLKSLGFERSQCPKCKNFFWRHTAKKTTCGDSQCEGKYSFIGVGTGIGRDTIGKDGKKVPGKKISYSDAWKGFERSLTSARVPCTSIPRYPVVARWRTDVDYVAAGIFCFQPYCVTGELEPPANPLICPQFCLRFNDLDNIGLTGRHYSGFIMLGIQVFNKKDNFKFWNEECLEFNYRWLTEELKIDPDEITFIEDVWAGGGNLGPSIEYFVGGLELGNMVFMQFKTFPDGRREPLQVQVIDVGIGLERVPWLINGSPTSYVDVFPSALKYLLGELKMNIEQKVWESYGPLSCLLNVDEVDDIEKTWDGISKTMGLSSKEVKAAIEPIREVYTVLDHTRTVMMAIEDGSLPSNVGGASNIRNILRRVFALTAKNGWFEKLGMDKFLKIFEHHKLDLGTIYGEFKEYPSFADIIKLEYHRWQKTDEGHKAQVQSWKRKVEKEGRQFELKDWIGCIQTYGAPPDTIAAEVKQDIPGNLWSAITEQQEREQGAKQAEAVLYNTSHLPSTDSLYYGSHKAYEFKGKILEVFTNVKTMRPDIVVLDQSAFYPTSGGQEHDTGMLAIDGVTYEVVNVEKVGPAVMHYLDKALPKKPEEYKGVAVRGKVDAARRDQLRNNHTATHIVFAACRKVLGPHVWQAGAKKTVDKAHLEITHYESISQEQMQAIENEANRIVHRSKPITKGFMPKDVAEKKYGFSLYQGGVVPGNELRVVNIADTDTEACCGTHADNTSEVGLIKLLRAGRTADGILRLEYVAGENALKLLNENDNMLYSLTSDWGVDVSQVKATASKFKDGFKKYEKLKSEQGIKILNLRAKLLLLDPEQKATMFETDESNPGLFIANCPQFAPKLKELKKNLVFVGEDFIYALCGNPGAVDWDKEVVPLLDVKKESKETKEKKKADDKGDSKEAAKAPAEKKAKAATKKEVVVPVEKKSKDKPVKVDGIALFQATSVANVEGVVEFLKSKGFVLSDQ